MKSIFRGATIQADKNLWKYPHAEFAVPEAELRQLAEVDAAEGNSNKTSKELEKLRHQNGIEPHGGEGTLF